MIKVPFIDVLPENRGDYQIVLRHPRGPIEVLYRTRTAARLAPVMSALERAWDRGVRAMHMGWPYEAPERSLFGLSDATGANKCPYGPPAVAVIEQHPRLESWDAPIYSTESRADAEMVLRAARRAASVACLWSAGLHTTRGL